VSKEAELQTKFEALAPFMGELQRRMWAATEAQLFGRGGVAAVHRATGIANSTILRGLEDLRSGRAENLANFGRARAKGAGLFCQITTNWRGRPLTSYQTIIDLFGATKTNTGLKVYAHLDPRTYEKGRQVTDAEMAALQIKRDSFHGEWNYVILPRRQR
jgi:hypothetical protein